MPMVFILTICYSQAAGEAVRRVCQEIPTEICELKAEAEDSDEDSSEESNQTSCAEQEWPLRVCETRLIPVTKTVQREECNGDIFPSASESRGLSDDVSYPRDFYQTTFLWWSLSQEAIFAAEFILVSCELFFTVVEFLFVLLCS